MNRATCEKVSLGLINGALCMGPFVIASGEVPDAIIKEMFLWMGLWQMNVSLQRQRNREGEFSLHPEYTSQWWLSLAFACLIFLRTITQRHRKSPHMQQCTDSFYILEVYGFLVFQLWWWLPLRCNVVKETGEGIVPVFPVFLTGLWSGQML